MFKSKKSKKQEVEVKPVVVEDNNVSITSSNSDFKLDGVVKVGDITQEGLVLNDNPFPTLIDVEARKNQKINDEKHKNNIRKKNANPNVNKATFASVIVLFIVVGGLCYWYFNKTDPEAFIVKTVSSEIGEELSTSISKYIEQEEKIDEMEFKLDISQVKTDIIGDYTYFVTKGDVKKGGTIKIVDSKGPMVEVKDFVTKLNSVVKVEDFVSSCSDISNCTLAFDKTVSTSTPGEQIVVITAIDKYTNKTVVEAKLNVLANLETLNCSNSVNYLDTYGYELEIKFILNYNDRIYYNQKFVRTYRFEDPDDYKKQREKLFGKDHYSFNDLDLMIYYNKDYKVGNSNINQMKEIFEKDEFICNITK